MQQYPLLPTSQASPRVRLIDVEFGLYSSSLFSRFNHILLCPRFLPTVARTVVRVWHSLLLSSSLSHGLSCLVVLLILVSCSQSVRVEGRDRGTDLSTCAMFCLLLCSCCSHLGLFLFAFRALTTPTPTPFFSCLSLCVCVCAGKGGPQKLKRGTTNSGARKRGAEKRGGRRAGGGAEAKCIKRNERTLNVKQKQKIASKCLRFFACMPCLFTAHLTFGRARSLSCFFSILCLRRAGLKHPCLRLTWKKLWSQTLNIHA